MSNDNPESQLAPDAIYNELVRLGATVNHGQIGRPVTTEKLWFYPPHESGDYWEVVLAHRIDGEDEPILIPIGSVDTVEHVSAILSLLWLTTSIKTQDILDNEGK